MVHQATDPAVTEWPGGAASPGQRHDAMFRSPAGFAIVGTDPDGIVTNWNAGAEHLFGWTAAEAVGCALPTVARPAGTRAPELTAGPAEDRWYERKDGTRFWGRGETIVLHAPDGSPLGALTLLRDRTEQLQRAESQRQDAEFLRGVLGSSGDCIKVLDLEGKLAFMSEGGQRVMEVSDFNLIRGCPWPDFWEGPGNLAARAALDAARQGGVGRFHGLANTFAGNPRFWDVQVTPILGVDGQPERLLSVSRDITVQMRAQEDLRFSEESHRLAVDAAEIGTWDLDIPADALTWSDRTKAMFGISPGVPCGMADFYAGLHPEDFAATSLAFASALDPLVRATYDVEYRTVGKEDGTIRWVAAKGRGIFDDSGTCIRALGTAIDISARKFAEARQAFRLDLWDRLQALSDPRAIMACAVEALGRFLAVSRVGYGLVQPDDQTVVLETSYVNGVARLSGAYRLDVFGAEDIARQRLGQTTHFSDSTTAPHQNPAVWAAIQTRAMVSIPLVRDGRLRASLYVNHVEPRVWTDKELALIADVAQRTWDAVERARAEAALREANDMLEQRIAAALQDQRAVEEKLRQSQKMEAVGQLTGGLAHDFNNLLTGIIGSLELIQSRLLQGRLSGLETFVAAGQGAAKRAAALTHRLLAFSRRQTLDPKPTDVNRLVADMEDLVRRTVGPKLTIEVVGACGLWGTLVDPPQLESALLNLCINARDAMPDGGRLMIETANAWIDDREAALREVAPGQYVVLSVSDTGTGMAPEVAKRAFDPFFTTKPIGQGTGLGLSMIYGFARQSGGDVRIYSEPGQGTTMRIYLPRHHLAETRDEGAPPSLDLSPSGHGETVLVIDDEPTVRMLVTEVLHDAGYAALEAGDGPGGLRLLQSNARIDLLITDVGLPGGMNGRQIADAARLLRPGLKVLFVTGYAENAAIGNGHLEPGMQVLTKPFSMDDLARRLRELLQR